jgi:hypothetical protein
VLTAKFITIEADPQPRERALQRLGRYLAQVESDDGPSACLAARITSLP